MIPFVTDNCLRTDYTVRMEGKGHIWKMFNDGIFILFTFLESQLIYEKWELHYDTFTLNIAVRFQWGRMLICLPVHALIPRFFQIYFNNFTILMSGPSSTQNSFISLLPFCHLVLKCDRFPNCPLYSFAFTFPLILFSTLFYES